MMNIFVLMFIGLISFSLTGCDLHENLSSNLLEIPEDTTNLKDLHAWNVTKWGMSSSQIMNLFPTSLKRNGSNLCPEVQEEYCSEVRLKDYKIGSQKYGVFLTFINDKLVKVGLWCEGDYSHACVRDIEYLLISKYGKPLKHETVKNSHNISFEQSAELYWETEYSSIDMSWNKRNMILIYRPLPQVFSVDTKASIEAKEKL